MRIYSIQRGTFRETPLEDDKYNGMDRALKFDYMGAAEYEFGALPRSLKRIRENKMNSIQIQIRDKYFELLYPNNLSSSEYEYIIWVLGTLADKDKHYKHQLKMGCRLHCFF